MRNNERFYCKTCNRFFDNAKIYDEKHGLDNPPYERIAVCSRCGDGNFVKFNLMVSKIDIVERMLASIVCLNRFGNTLKDIFGLDIKNNDFDDGIEIIVEAIAELFDVFDNDIQKEIFKMCSDADRQRVLLMLRGEL